MIEGLTMMRRALGTVGLVLMLTGCAADMATSPSLAPATSLAAARGRSVAEIRCAGCHAIGANGDSRGSGAPPFAQIRIRYNAISWERVMEEIARGRHGEMPPITLGENDIADLRTYIETLR
jgi:mono/diheme cytochrome c family protein